jgi:hypothetical protein
MSPVRTAIAGITFAALVGAAAAQPLVTQGSEAKRLVGTWRLVSMAQKGGPNPSGLLYDDAGGHMAVQIMTDPSLRRPFSAAQPTPEEAQAAVRDYIAYFGTYSVDERAHRVTHHREGALTPGPLPDFVRRYEFLDGDRLALTLGDDGNRLVFERLR